MFGVVGHAKGMLSFQIVSVVSLELDWSKACSGLTRPLFEGRHPYAFLVRTTPAGGGTASERTFRTQIHSVQAKYSTSPAPGLPDEERIFPLIKAPRNPFLDRVSVGRAPNCDVIIQDPSVSKLHGYFCDITLEAAVFTDAKSANGTRVNGIIVPPGTSIAVQNGTHIIFGRIQCVFLAPGDVYDRFCP